MRLLKVSVAVGLSALVLACRTSQRSVTSRVDGATLSLSNDAVAAEWEVSGGKLRSGRFEDRLAGGTLALPESAFWIGLADGSEIRASEMRVVGGSTVEERPGNARASSLSERLDGRCVSVVLEDEARLVRATWRAILREGSTYLRQEVTLESPSADLPVRTIRLVDLHAPGAQVIGTVRGSPVVAGSRFFAVEHPLSTSAVEGDRVRCALERTLDLRAGHAITESSVIGVTPPGGLRRGFQQYLERERAHPYRPFLHYNSWYDLGYFTPFDEASALAVIQAFGTELSEKRGVALRSFLFDDGWDDPATLWKFHSGFPRGFESLKEATARIGAAPGVWLSPWGGYGKPREERLAHGKASGFEINAQGFSLSGPTYYRRFEDTCLEMIRRYGVNQFKFDGTGSAGSASPGSEFGSDFEAAIHLIDRLRAEKPDLFVNLTTGTYPSPFWLVHADSIWRGGEDHSFTGVGSDRQKWITYRDAQTFKNVVTAGPLFPLNSLMLHGLIFAKHANRLDRDPGGDFMDEVRSYFGSGTQLQEMYVSHNLLSPRDWDAIAEAADWSLRSADALVDTHWVGGDPEKLEPYGWASWSPKKAVLVFRNPSDRAQSMAVDVARAFELEPGAPRRYRARVPWREATGRAPIDLVAGRVHTFELQPFEVLTLDAIPVEAWGAR